MTEVMSGQHINMLAGTIEVLAPVEIIDDIGKADEIIDIDRCSFRTTPFFGAMLDHFVDSGDITREQADLIGSADLKARPTHIEEAWDVTELGMLEAHGVSPDMVAEWAISLEDPSAFVHRDALSHVVRSMQRGRVPIFVTKGESMLQSIKWAVMQRALVENGIDSSDVPAAYVVASKKGDVLEASLEALEADGEPVRPRVFFDDRVSSFHGLDRDRFGVDGVLVLHPDEKNHGETPPDDLRIITSFDQLTPA